MTYFYDENSNVYTFDTLLILVSNNKNNIKNGAYSEHLTKWIEKDNVVKESWKISDSDIEKVKTFDTKFKIYTISLPKDKKFTNPISKLREKYLVMVPISKQESIGFFKNLYSDRNLMTICDADDSRKECDLRLTGNYQYNTLPQKVKEMFSVACNNLRGYKMYAKMDFDAYMKKDY
ncbi:hypothetical protein BB558_000861, partial [Smittium angustum]